MTACTNTGQLLTRLEVAEALRVSLRLTDRLIGRGELPSLLVGGRRLVRAEDLERYVAGQVRAAAGDDA